MCGSDYMKTVHEAYIVYATFNWYY